MPSKMSSDEMSPKMTAAMSDTDSFQNIVSEMYVSGELQPLLENAPTPE